MTTEKKEREAGSERERILALRQAFVNGAFEMAYRQSAANSIEAWARLGEFHALADKAYPLPKVTRPRVVKDPGIRGLTWTVRDGQLKTESFYGTMFEPTAERVKLWADLLANPTEQVEAE